MTEDKQYPKSAGNPRNWIVPCGYCGAPAGTPCVTPKGQYYGFSHKVRMDDADYVREHGVREGIQPTAVPTTE